ncbi:uncharacterized protein LOC110059672 [Orbicella faveolata]|uniref:uncharacterized protein LOC110059672 n=1 Tax=Orbicella faveolata TaxID=48498 RepID=UPI0009E4B955|nr:uncharacterized protein LOC110059672 [Orbicella faveolata]
MRGDLFGDPRAGSFPRVQATGNPFDGFGGFYGERPRSFWEDPVYFPSEKPRRVSNRKKTRRVVEEDRQSDGETIIPTRFLHREKPWDKKVKKDGKQTCPSQLKLSQHARDVPIPIEIRFGEENGLNEGFAETSLEEVHWDDSKQLSRDQTSSVEPRCTEKEEKGASDINQTTAIADDSQLETKTAEKQKFDEIESVLAKAKELIPRVEAFKGSKQDKEYLYLEEHLTRCLLSLDLVETDGQGKLKSARRAAVKEILSIGNDLEARVPEKLDN